MSGINNFNLNKHAYSAIYVQSLTRLQDHSETLNAEICRSQVQNLEEDTPPTIKTLKIKYVNVLQWNSHENIWGGRWL